MTEKEHIHQASAHQSQHSASTTQPLPENIGETVSQVADQAKQQVSQLTDQAKQQLTSQVDAQKERMSETLASVAGALRKTGEQLRDGDQAAIGEYANKAAEQIERFSGFLHDQDLNGLMHEAEQLARRQPALFLGGAFVLGILGARFLKSTQPQPARYYPPANSGYRGVYDAPPRPMGRGYGPNYNPTNQQQQYGRPGYPNQQPGYQGQQQYGRPGYPNQQPGGYQGQQQYGRPGYPNQQSGGYQGQQQYGSNQRSQFDTNARSAGSTGASGLNAEYGSGLDSQRSAGLGDTNSPLRRDEE